jgi:PIN domain nuclease of toxin-antitoxin system
MYITDTHSFLWYISEDEKLGKKAKEVFEKCDSAKDIMVIPSIVLIEAMFLCEKKKVYMKFEDVLFRLQTSSNYQIYPLDERVVVECKNIKLPDPHDRIIVATAKLLNATLITKDKKIKNSKIVKTIW